MVVGAGSEEDDVIGVTVLVDLKMEISICEIRSVLKNIRLKKKAYFL